MKIIYYTILALFVSLKSFGNATLPEAYITEGPVESLTTVSEVSMSNAFINIVAEETTSIRRQNQVMIDTRLKIRLGFSAASNFKRQILITVDDRASEGIDYGFDAKLKEIFPNDLYWVIDGNKCNIQGIDNWSEKCVIPIGINSKGDGPIKIKIDTIENAMPNMEVYLRDNSTLETFEIVNGNFEIDLEEGEYNDKYAIVFEPKIEISEEEELEEIAEIEEQIEPENTIEEMSVYISGNNFDQLTIKKPEDMELTHISIFNILGQQIKVWNSNLNQREMELSFHSKKGVHIVLMNTNKGRISKKVIVN